MAGPASPRALGAGVILPATYRLHAFEQLSSTNEEAKRLSLVEQADALRGQSITIVAKVTDERKLYGSIDAAQIAEAITRDLGFPTEAKQIHLPDSIKELGTYDISVRLHPKVSTTVKLWAVEE